MRPLTDHTPKPLLQVQGKTLIQWHLEGLARVGVPQAVINTAWLGEQFEPALGQRFGSVAIRYSHEGQDFGAALETAGGICRALPMLSEVFGLAAGDVYAPDFEFSPASVQAFLQSRQSAHIWLVPNPEHNPAGDFAWDAATGLARNVPQDSSAARYTYSTIGLFRKAFFTAPWCAIAPGNAQGVSARLAPMLRAAMDQGLVSASLYTGRWADVGTPQRFAQLNQPSVVFPP